MRESKESEAMHKATMCLALFVVCREIVKAVAIRGLYMDGASLCDRLGVGGLVDVSRRINNNNTPNITSTITMRFNA